MPISELELESMSSIGAQVTSKETYSTIRGVLEDRNAAYQSKATKIFLQGSYANDTNVIGESDVDIIIRLDSAFTYDLSLISDNQKNKFQAAFPISAAYKYSDFRGDVVNLLIARFDSEVVIGSKAIQISPKGNRRKADVLVAIKHRKYFSFDPMKPDDYLEGISFYKKDGTHIVNFPQLHKDYLVEKNKRTLGMLKHVIRIFKNLRKKLVEQKIINIGSAPSYFIEGMLSNVPDELFNTSTYTEAVINCIDWLKRVDSSKLFCANMQHRLINGGADISWNKREFEEFIFGAAHVLFK
ncbi:nucleotidyltransferase [Polynucleobacter sp. MWH-UH19D]|uniref:nucleotidyltransferase domain-containing protein n=1 Tax=Polynucleobacter sp. MWH-UH19D TaxID=1855610 RepID=UPI003364EE0D